MVITFMVLAAFFAVIIVVLHVSKKRQDLSTFSHYAVGERSFSSWFVAMAYTNSWWPGATFTVFFGLGVTSGVLGLYALVYTVLGVMAMYFMARPVWKWGKKFDLRTQSDLLVLRYNKRAIKPLSSIISSLALFPWLVLGLQAMGAVISWASFGRIPLTTCIVVGVGLIAIRQFWTIQMGMRGLIISDMVQGIVAYVGSALLSLGLIMFYFHGLSGVGELPAAKLTLPDFDSTVGGWFYFGIVAAGIIGSLCWPNIMTRIYTAGSVRQVKKGVIQTMVITLLFYGLMTLVAMAAIPLAIAAGNPEAAWFSIAEDAGGTWLLAAAVLIVFAAAMGFVDGVVQSLGTQMANDIIGIMRPLRDKQEIVIAKSAMAVYVLLAAIVAYQTYSWSHLIDLAQLSYQAIIQIAVPLFAGLFWRRGNSVAAIAGMMVGTAVAIGLSITYFSEAGAIPWLAGVGSGLVGLAANLVLYVLCSYLVPTSQAERTRVNELFEHARSGRVVVEATPSAVTSAGSAPGAP
ncbi:sodium:solute symporter family protein [Saccharopolyspora sp. NPDC000995]